MPHTAEGHRPVLIEDWLPIRELGIESVRERQAASALPPLSFLHIWWARRPLAGAQGVQLAALLPPWDDTLLDTTEGLAEALERVRGNRQDINGDHRASMTNEDWYRTWVLWLSGVWGDTVAAQRIYDAAKASGVRVQNPFTWKQAYKNKPAVEDLNVLHRLLVARWGRVPHVLDPTAGGGSIPFTSQRYGLPTYANDLNPVAVGVLEASLHATSEFGPALTKDLQTWGQVLVDRLNDRLAPFFPSGSDGQVATFLWVNTVACPRTGGPVPLSPNWWLDKKDKGTAVQPVPVRTDDGEPSYIDYRVITDVESSDFDPDEGTVARGDAVSPWDGLVIDGDYIKAEAQAGRVWPELFAVACTRPKKVGRGRVRYFRAPTETDLAAVESAEKELARLEGEEWSGADVIPDEPIPGVMNDPRPRIYGMDHWRKFFSSRQLLVHGSFVEEWRRLLPELREALPDDRANAVAGLLAAGFANKSLNYNSRLSSWHVSKQVMRSVFERHDFAFKWTFAEFEGAGQLWSWCLSQLLDAYRGIAGLLHPDNSGDGGLIREQVGDHPTPASVVVSAKSATDLDHLEDGSVECVNIDPPYYDNVQYAELANYFYVWEKRTLGVLHPDRFSEELTDSDNEAVANPARFAEAGRRKKELASFDYQQKMQAIFAEAKRVLTEDGVLVVWFTHKAADAWDVLGTAMIDAGFTIETSWPVNTESATSLHQANVNSAASTIILVCRKRRADSDGVFFEEIEADVRRAAVDAVTEYGDTVGVTGVDLQLSTYGPTLSVISSRWPVLSDEAGEDGRARRLRPEEALAVAREEVNRLVKARLVGHAAQFDDATDFWLLCWANFQAREFPYDEARKLGMSTLDVDDAVQAGLVKKKSGKVELVKPVGRGRSLRSKMADSGRFPTLVDALHHLLNSYRDDGLASTRTWLADSGYKDERAFLDTLQAAVNAIPRVRTKKGLSVTEAQELEDVVIALFGDQIEIPAEVEELIEAEQTTLEV